MPATERRVDGAHGRKTLIGCSPSFSLWSLSLLPLRVGGRTIQLIGVKTRRSRAGPCRRTDEEEDDAMHTTEIQNYARQLLEAHGARAIAEAAQKALASERSGDKEHAETWRRVEAALMLMRGPRQT